VQKFYALSLGQKEVDVMQTDFHFYAVYALARAAGFNPVDSHIVAYSSEHTDDAKYEHALKFENGGRFQQVLTAHQYLNYKVGIQKTCYQIWLPFHFLPGNLGVDFFERMVPTLEVRFLSTAPHN
jgi:hypothetical protein